MRRKIQRISPYNFGASGNSLAKLFAYDVPRSRSHNKLLEVQLPKIWGWKHPIYGVIFDHFQLWSRISPERLQMSNIGNKHDRQQFLPRLRNKNPVNFGLQTQKLFWLTLTHPNRFSGQTTFRPLGVAASDGKFHEIFLAWKFHWNFHIEIFQKFHCVKFC